MTLGTVSAGGHPAILVMDFNCMCTWHGPALLLAQYQVCPYVLPRTDTDRHALLCGLIIPNKVLLFALRSNSLCYCLLSTLHSTYVVAGFFVFCTLGNLDLNKERMPAVRTLLGISRHA